MDQKNTKLILGIVLGVGAIYLLSQELFDGGRDVGNGRSLQAGGGGNGNSNRNKLTAGGGAGEIGNGVVGSGGSIAHGIISSGLGRIVGIGAAVGAAYLLTSGELGGRDVGNG
jgi:hypothetical protein